MAALPNMKYIHVTRHGLDMAYSSNQTQLRVWGPLLLGRGVDSKSADDSLAYWCAAHERLLKLCKLAFPKVLFLPFERIFTNADSTLTKLCSFLDIPTTSTSVQDALSAIHAPDSIGRHRYQQRLSISTANTRLLQRLGYDDDSLTR